MNRKTVKIISALIVAAFILGIIGPFAYNLVFSEPIDDIQTLEIQIDEIKVQIEENEKRFSAAEELEQNIIKESGERFRIMCERGISSYLDIIFSAENMMDFTDRVVIAKELAEYDKNVIASIQKIRKEIETASNESKELLAELEEKLAELEILEEAEQ